MFKMYRPLRQLGKLAIFLSVVLEVSRIRQII